MAKDIKSPDSLDIKGKPKIGSRFGKKAIFFGSSIIFFALVLIMYGIATREGSSITSEEAAKKTLNPATSAGKKLYEGIGDGVSSPPALASANPDIQLPDQPKNLTAGKNEEKKQDIPNLQDAQKSQPGQVQQQLTPEQMAAQKLHEQREMERFKAIQAESSIKFDEIASNPQPQPTANDMAKLFGANQPGMIGSSAPLLQNQAQDDQNKQLRKESFLQNASQQALKETLSGSRRLQISPFELKAGTVIPSVLWTGLNSDLPGEIIGQVSENVFDTATGAHMLIPQGTKIFGRYDSQVAFGQDRALVVWDRLIFPDGSSLTLEGMGGSDKSGYAGFNDQVNNHVWRLIGYGAISSAFASIFQITQRRNGNNNNSNTQNPQDVAAGEVARQFSQMGIQMNQKNLNIQPTIEIRPGYQFIVLVNRDVVFQEPYSDKTPISN